MVMALDHVFFFSMPSFLGQMAVLALHNAKHQEDMPTELLATGAAPPDPMQSQHGHLAQERGVLNKILQTNLETLLLQEPGKLEHPSFLGQMAVLALHNAKHQEDMPTELLATGAALAYPPGAWRYAKPARPFGPGKRGAQ
jgi:hypothetical protein